MAKENVQQPLGKEDEALQFKECACLHKGQIMWQSLLQCKVTLLKFNVLQLCSIVAEHRGSTMCFLTNRISVSSNSNMLITFRSRANGAWHTQSTMDSDVENWRDLVY